MTNCFRALSAFCAAVAIAAAGVVGASAQNWGGWDDGYNRSDQSQRPSYGDSGGSSSLSTANRTTARPAAQAMSARGAMTLRCN